MKRNSKIGVLQKRFPTLRIFLIRRERDWNLRSKLAVAAEIRRLREQIELQNTMRCRIAMSSFNINALSDEECLVKYRFTRNDIGFISKLIPWDSCLDHRGRMSSSCKFEQAFLELSESYVGNLQGSTGTKEKELEIQERKIALEEKKLAFEMDERAAARQPQETTMQAMLGLIKGIAEINIQKK
jgi:hypothetical protein